MLALFFAETWDNKLPFFYKYIFYFNYLEVNHYIWLI